MPLVLSFAFVLSRSPVLGGTLDRAIAYAATGTTAAAAATAVYTLLVEVTNTYILSHYRRNTAAVLTLLCTAV